MNDVNTEDTPVTASVKVIASIAPRINLAFQQNAVPVIAELRIQNETECELSDVTISIGSVPPVVQPKLLRIDRVRAGGTHHVSLVDLTLDPGILVELREATKAKLTLKVTDMAGPVATIEHDIDMLTPNHWAGMSVAPELIAALVQPNDPSVDAVLRIASSKLSSAGRAPGIDGYTSGLKTRAWEIAEAIWAALVDQSIAYVLPPASFEQEGQKVRFPSDILDRKVGTCLDLTLLYAACLEQAGLNPVIVLTQGHAFAGVWLKDEDFSLPVIEDAQTLRKRLGLEEMLCVETTLLTGDHPARFRQAVDSGAVRLTEDTATTFEMAIDIRRCRRRQIRPIAYGADAKRGPLSPGVAGPASASELEAPPSFQEEVHLTDPLPSAADRLENWKRKLLDLSLRNRLLNFKDTKKAVTLEAPDPALLEDKLASGVRLKLQARAGVLSGDDPRNAQLHLQQTGEDGRRRYAEEALTRGEVHVNLEAHDLDARLTDLYRSAVTAMEEGGANTLHLAIGFLKWTPSDSTVSHKAPLILLPVRLERRSVRSGFRLTAHDEDPRFNPTLLEFLRKDFRLVMPELEGDLPTDASGIDVAKIWRIVQAHVRDLAGWEVTTEIVLATFSFTKHLMWKDLVDRTDLLKRSNIVRHLMDTPRSGYGQGDGEPFVELHDLDTTLDPAQVFAPLSADSSQIAAVLAASRGKDFVLFGPPGTGKSQTIANIISQMLAEGRTVLFVSQKTAALEVVRRRLQKIELGQFCLEVHSTKAQKSEVLAQLRSAWHDRTSPREDEWGAATQDLKSLRDELNALVSALHRVRSNGLTAYAAFGRVVWTRGRLPEVRLAWDPSQEHTQETLAKLRGICREAMTALDAVGTIQGHPLEGLGRRDWSPSWQSDLFSALDAFESTCAAFKQRVLAFCGLIELGEPQASYTAMMALTALGGRLCDPRSAAGYLFLTPEAGRIRAAVERLRPVVEKASELRTRLSTPYRDGILALDIPGLVAEWHAAVASNMFVRSGRKKRVRAKLAAFCDGQVPEDCGRDLALLIELVALAAEVKEMASDLRLLGPAYDGLSTDLVAIEAGVKWSQEVERICQAIAPQETDRMVDFVATLVRDRAHLFAEGADGRARANELHNAWGALRAALKILCELAETDAYLGLNIRQDWFAHVKARTQSWKGARQRLPMWCAWRKVAEDAKTWGLGPLMEAVQSGMVDRQGIPTVFEASYAAWWIERVVDVDPVLRGFVAQRQEDAIARFREADERVAELAKRIVRARLSGNVPPPTAFGQDVEWGTLSRELEKRARHMPLRQLFAKLPHVLPKLAPCVMMSPLSIAQYLPADAKPFDVIVFDEASQIPVWDAIGALARGNQAIIVGDPKQLPPTTFFDRTDDDLGQDAYDTEDLESILDECLASNVPHRRLTWHYRSRHESLIAFSNARYYEGELITFPSPVTEDQAVSFVHVPGGVYERGSGQVNRMEAQKLVEDVVRRLKDPCFALDRLSIGIVSFNSKQQTLIENLLDQERRKDASIEQFFSGREWHEPVFVKNLENVQGDERDIILFSVGYGPDAAGRVSHNFGPLNKIGGERRLNVAITRARRELVVFSTLRPEDINLARAPGRGVRDFKHFLEYAERGARALAEAFAPTGRGTDSPFEEAVKAMLEGKGWEVHPQVGVAGFRIDLGVVHPDIPGRYLVGVECDGATYHRAATARDRDRLREMVLRDLGWQIRRVWSTEWWMDAATAFERLHAQMMQDLEEERRLTVEKAAAVASWEEDHEEATTDAMTPDDGASIEPDTDAEDESQQEPFQDTERPRLVARGYTIEPAAPFNPSTLVPYSPTDLLATFTPEPLKFYETAYRSVLQRMVADVISREGPIMESMLVRRIARAHGFQHAGPRIQKIIQGVVEDKFQTSREGDRTIYWPEGADNAGFWPLRGPGPDPRSVADIPLAELAARARELLRETAAVDEIVARMAQDLGLGRIRQPTRARLMDAIRLAGSSPPASR